MSFSTEVKQKLFTLIDEMDSYHWLFTKNPGKDFSRKKKWSFAETIKFMLTMEGKSLKDELLQYFDFSNQTPSNSSFNQRRAQILPKALEFLFHEFTKAFHKTEDTDNGYRLLACDGSELCIAHNPKDESTYFQSDADWKGFNQVHLNVLFDLCSRTYVDGMIQPSRQKNECKAMCQMIDRYSGSSNTIFIADRGYESYHIFAHVEQKGMFYLVRAKDIASNGIISSLKEQLPCKDIFDEWVQITLTRKQTKEVKNNPHKYRILMKAQPFEYLDLHTNPFYKMQMCMVRFPISDSTYECIITNLPQNIFPLDRIKELYHRRWGIETSFRELKYAIGLTRFHSKKMEYIKQEIWARLTLYNFCAIITMSILVKEKKERKHRYQINYTHAIRICRYFLSIKKEKAPPDVEYLISHELLPVRTGRSDPRKVKPQSWISFLYR